MRSWKRIHMYVDKEVKVHTMYKETKRYEQKIDKPMDIETKRYERKSDKTMDIMMLILQYGVKNSLRWLDCDRSRASALPLLLTATCKNLD